MISRIARRLRHLGTSQTSPLEESIFLSRQPQYAQYNVGDWSYGRPDIVSWGEGASLTVGRFCSIAEGVTILLGGEHRVDWVTTYPFPVLFQEASGFSGHPRTKGDVVIGNDVWVGTEALILSGVTIGDGAVIAARAVVTGDVEPFTIVGGNPARKIRTRFPDHIVDALVRISWWNWPLEKIVAALPLLLAPDIEKFVTIFDKES